jgi:hypothetical protein
MWKTSAEIFREAVDSAPFLWTAYENYPLRAAKMGYRVYEQLYQEVTVCEN